MSVVDNARSVGAELYEGFRYPHNSAGKVAFAFHYRVLKVLVRFSRSPGKVDCEYDSNTDRLDFEAAHTETPAFWGGFIYFGLIALAYLGGALPVMVMPSGVWDAWLAGNQTAAIVLAVALWYYTLGCLATLYLLLTVTPTIEGEEVS